MNFVGEARGERIKDRGSTLIKSLLLLPACGVGIFIARRFPPVSFHIPPLGINPTGKKKSHSEGEWLRMKIG
jgi:hypothetical protein